MLFSISFTSTTTSTNTQYALFGTVTTGGWVGHGAAFDWQDSSPRF